VRFILCGRPKQLYHPKITTVRCGDNTGGAGENPGSDDARQRRAVQLPSCGRGGLFDQCYVADRAALTIRKITPLGLVTTLAGLAGSKGCERRHRQRRAVNNLNAVAVDPSAMFYVADTDNQTIR